MQSVDSIVTSRILLIDDNEGNLALLQTILEMRGYRNLYLLSDPTKAKEVVREFNPDLIILDLHMPVMDGFEVLSAVRSDRPANMFIPVLVFTADTTSSAKERALSLGASDFLTKPGDATEILLRAGNFLKSRRMHLQIVEHAQTLSAKVLKRTEELEIARLETLRCLARSSEYRDDDTGNHTLRVGENSARIGEAYGLSSAGVSQLRQSAPLHDIGKIGIPDQILLKPSKLTQAEFETMKTHTTIGGRILEDSQSPVLVEARIIALHHHERWDGTGYPANLRGSEIPLVARIVAVADAYDAIVSDRPYRKGVSRRDAVHEILANSGTQFDPRVVQAFMKSSIGLP